MPGSDIAHVLSRFPWTLLVAGAALATLCVFALVPLAHRAGWLDRPDARKKHVGAVPLVGGWALLITAGLIQALMPDGRQAPVGYWVGALLLFIVAVVDDRFPIRARYRLMVQITAAVAGVTMGGQMLLSLGGLLGLDAWSHWVLGLAVAIVGAVAVINAVNFTDGADGLCAGLGLVSLGWFVVALAAAQALAAASGIRPEPFVAGMMPLAATMMGALIGFLIFNMRAPWRRRASIFLGDSGSMLIGFTLAWFAVHVASGFGAASVPASVCLWIVAVPLADSASCIVRRCLSGVTPMTADLKHLHHLLPKYGWTTGESVALINLAAIFCGMVGVGGWWLGVSERALLVGFALTLAAFIAWTWFAWRRIDRRGVASGVSVTTTTVSGSDRLSRN